MCICAFTCAAYTRNPMNPAGTVKYAPGLAAHSTAIFSSMLPPAALAPWLALSGSAR